jgi:hypothetical protein
MKSFSIMNYIIFLVTLIVLLVFYNRFENKMNRENEEYTNKTIQDYLLDGSTLAKSKKPVLWVHVPYEYNSRNWLSFGSRSSFDLNQPYLYLTVRSIINQCDDSFTICLIDDTSFGKLIPGWNIDVKRVTDPILDNVRKLGLMKLIEIYGGMLCPLSFVCMKDLIGLYNKGTAGNSMFVCETTDRNITSTTNDFYPNILFSGAPKQNNTVKRLIEYIQYTMSVDYTSETAFLGNYNRWVNSRTDTGEIHLINGMEIGIKTYDDRPILLEDLMSNNYLKIYPNTYGILIPSVELLNRRKYEWFTRMSEKQVLESNTIIGNYLLVNQAEGGNILEPLSMRPKGMVGFWKVPSNAPVWGLKPNFLGDNLRMLSHPDN